MAMGLAAYAPLVVDRAFLPQQSATEGRITDDVSVDTNTVRSGAWWFDRTNSDHYRSAARWPDATIKEDRTQRIRAKCRTWRCPHRFDPDWRGFRALLLAE